MEIDEREKKGGGKRKKVVGVKLEICWPHIPPKNGGAVKKILTLPQKPPFVHQTTPYTPPK
jgi:hypothetical protein